jgi:type II secretory pathway pseudopilin PulG
MDARQRGFTYLGILIAVALNGAVMGVTLEVWHTAQARERERELLFVGRQFRQAIERYYRATPGREKKYPASLEELLEDPRLPGTQRYLRRIYRDPLTGVAEWGFVRDGQGAILGVRSLSEARPIKAAGFDEDEAEFAEARQYSDWQFVYRPAPAGPLQKPGGGNDLG